MLKKYFCLICALMLLMSIPCFSNAWTDMSIESEQKDLNVTESEYLSVDEYFAKYGEENIKEGFKEAEAKATGKDLAEVEEENTDGDNKGRSLFEAVSEGEFLGMEILGISDLSPDNPNLSFCVESDGSAIGDSLNSEDSDLDLSAPSASLLSSTTGSVAHYTNYDIYYRNTNPDSTELSYTYEPNSGSYVYKRSYSYGANYLCEMDVTFNNTQLKSGNQDNNMYVYLNATSSSRALDFGLMAAPSASDRNQGMYAFYRFSDETSLHVEAFPKVSASSYNLSNKSMTLENESIQLRLSIGNQTAEMYMEKDNSCAYYKVIESNNISSGSSQALTFTEAVTCVAASGITSLTSGSYFTNINLTNSNLYSFTNGTRQFSTQGTATYYTMVCKPSKVNYSYSGNSDTISINYN